MSVEVGELADDGNRKPHVHLLVRNWSVQRVVHKVGDIGPEQPVIRTVAVHVGDGRGCMAEAMDKEGLQLSFGVVEAPCVEGVGLHGVDHLALWEAEVGVDLGEVVEEGEDEQGAEVFEEEECPVGYLGPQVLKHNLWHFRGQAVFQLLGCVHWRRAGLPWLQWQCDSLSFRVILAICNVIVK